MKAYLICAAAGGLAGYFVLYKLIGCSGASCPITASPYISTLSGIILGILLAYAIASPAKNAVADSTGDILSTQYVKISAEEAKARIDSGDEIIILDVRTDSEFRAGHIPNAVLIPNETISDKMPELLPDLNAEILIYCRSGNRSAQAAKKLISIGYTNIYDFGGINDWSYEIVREP